MMAPTCPEDLLSKDAGDKPCQVKECHAPCAETFSVRNLLISFLSACATSRS